MKLPDFLQDENFNRLRKQMGAPLSQWQPATSWSPIRPIKKVVPIGDIKPVEDGTLEWEGERVAAYIRDQYGSSDSASEPEKLNKVHVADCDTLQQMRRKGKYDVRYVATNQTDGTFVVNFLGEFGSGDIAEGVECRLYVCKNCLKFLNYKNYNECVKPEQIKIKESFSLEEFFEVYGTWISDPPKETDWSAPINTYTEDWDKVSLRCRESAKWQCSKCAVFLGDENMKKFLQVHHINGQKSDNSNQNLQVLCIVCHAKIDSKLKYLPDYAEYLRIKRISG